MRVIEIVETYLRESGYDGLVCPGECGCEIGHLNPCGLSFVDCEPAYKGKCVCGEGCDWDMYPVKPQKDGFVKSYDDNESRGTARDYMRHGGDVRSARTGR